MDGCSLRANVAGDAAGSSFSFRGGRGGGIFNHKEGLAEIRFSSIDRNVTGSSGNLAGGGGGIFNIGQMRVYNTTISRNLTGSDVENGGPGGGIFNGADLLLINSTISGNKTGTGFFGTSSSGKGGGLYNENMMGVYHSTIAGNWSGDRILGGRLQGSGKGGGVYNDAELELSHTVVADNVISETGAGPDCFGAVTSLGYNLIGDTSDCMVEGEGYGNLLDMDPQLSPLVDNGGTLDTHALLPGSPAIDAGDAKFPGGSVYETIEPPAFDQRGQPRVLGERIDIGAFEAFTN